MEFKHQKTAEIIKWFEELSKIPRCSKNEEAIAQWPALVRTTIINGAVTRFGPSQADSVVIDLHSRHPADPCYENKRISQLKKQSIQAWLIHLPSG